MKSKFEKRQLQIHGYSISPSISRRQACEILGCSERTIDRLRKRDLPSFKVGNAVNFVLKDVLDYRKRLIKEAA